MGNPHMEPCKYAKCRFPAKMIDKTATSTHILKKHDDKSYHDVCLLEKLRAEGRNWRG